LADAEMVSFKDYINKSNEELKPTKIASDSAIVLINGAKAIQKQIDEKKTDFIRFKGYIPRFKVVGSDKTDFQVIKDSLYVYLFQSMSIYPV